MPTIVHGWFSTLTLGLTCVAILFTLSQSSPTASTLISSSVRRTGGKYDCLSDNECPIREYCQDGELLEFGECLPLRKENAKCESLYDDEVWVHLEGPQLPGWAFL